MYAAQTLWNAIDLHIRLLPFDTFKKKVKTHLSEVLCKFIFIIVYIICMIFLFLQCVSTVIIVYNYQYKSTGLVSLHTLDIEL